MQDKGKNDSLAGKVILADPLMMDTNFKKAVLIMAEYGQKGAIGFVLNKKLNFTLSEIINDSKFNFDPQIYFGGPVQQDNLFFLHSIREIVTDGSLEIAPNLFWGGDFESLQSDECIKYIKPDNIRFFLGYSGWDFEQIQDEMKENSWIVADKKINNLLRLPVGPMWFNLMKKIGGNKRIWINTPEHIFMN